jgi:hypothetical protein
VSASLDIFVTRHHYRKSNAAAEALRRAEGGAATAMRVGSGGGLASGSSGRRPRRPVRTISSWLLLGVVGGLGLLLALLGSPADAHLPGTVTNFYLYSSSTCPINKPTEPVNIVFTGYANSSRTVNHLRTHTGWTGSAGNTRYFKGHDYSCSGQNWQRAAGSSTYHWHARGRTLHSSSSTDATTFGSAHLEVVKACGHAVKPSGFDSGRERVFTLFGGPAGLADHPSAYIRINWGNSRNFLQCDNAFAGGNGKVYSIRIPNALHP